MHHNNKNNSKKIKQLQTIIFSKNLGSLSSYKQKATFSTVYAWISRLNSEKFTCAVYMCVVNVMFFYKFWGKLQNIYNVFRLRTIQKLQYYYCAFCYRVMSPAANANSLVTACLRCAIAARGSAIIPTRHYYTARRLGRMSECVLLQWLLRSLLGIITGFHVRDNAASCAISVRQLQSSHEEMFPDLGSERRDPKNNATLQIAVITTQLIIVYVSFPVIRPTPLLLAYLYTSLYTRVCLVFFRIVYFVNLLCATDRHCCQPTVNSNTDSHS